MAQNWSVSGIHLPPFHTVTAKLKRLRQALKVWNKEVFGDLEANIATAEASLQSV